MGVVMFVQNVTGGKEMSDSVKEIIGSVFSVAVKVVLAILVVMFIYKYALLAYNYGYRVFTEPPVSTGQGRDITVSIGEDTSVKEIGEMLETKGLVRDGKLFFLQELGSENHGKIKSGKYVLNTNMTANEMIAIMAQAEAEVTEEDLLYNEDENPLADFEAQDSDELEDYIIIDDESEGEE